MKSKWFKVFILSLLGLIVFCMTAIAFGILPLSGLPLAFIGACLGAIVSAIITQILLSGQTDREEIKERNVKVFQKKSKLFDKYIEKLWEILKKQELTIDDYEMLRRDFSTRLMIYLKEKDNETIANHLKDIGKCINNIDGDYYSLKKNIFGIINVFSKALDLGGQIDLELVKDLEEPILPLLFKQAIHNELNRAFSDPVLQRELSEGKFLKEDDLITDGEWGGEYLCFNFRRFKGCKLLIGSFSKYCPHGGIWMLLFVEKDIHAADNFRYSDEDGEEERFCEFSRYLVEIWDEGGEDGQWVNLVAPYPNDKEYDDDYKKFGTFNVPPGDGWLFLDSPGAIDPYRNNYQKVANIMSERAKYWFKNSKIWEKENDTLLSITEFLEKYLGK